MREELEEARERRFWGAVLRAIWTSVVAALVLGALAWLTSGLGWSRHLLLCVLGLLAGSSVSIAAAGSRRGRQLTALAVGAGTLPLLAAHLAGSAASGASAFDAHSAALSPFLAYALGGLAGGLAIAAIWRGRPPARDDAEAFAEEVAPGAGPGAHAPAAAAQHEGNRWAERGAREGVRR